VDPVVGSPKARVRRASTDSGKFAWKNIAPADGEPREKKKDGKDYVHCPNHGDLQWVLKEGHLKGCNNAPAAATPKPDKVAEADPKVVAAVVTVLAGLAEDAE
jgi:hypothetical protein